MRVTIPMLRIFIEITKGTSTLEALAQAQHKSVNWITEVIQDLEKEGFVSKKRNYATKGSRILIEISPTSHALKLKELLFAYSGISFEEILTDSRLLFLEAISEDWMSMEIAMQLSGISKYSIEKYRPQLKKRGVIMQKKNLYTINEKAWPLLKEFLLAYKNYGVVEGQVKWKYNNEVLFEVNNEKLIQDNATGLYTYKDFGIEVGVVSALCILPKSKLIKEEVFVHSLFEVKDPRTLHLALTFYIKNKLDYSKVMPLAMKYGKYIMFENFITLLKTKEEKLKYDCLPEFEMKDFIRIAKMYGVDNV